MSERPLVFMVNRRSGGQLGPSLDRRLREHLPAETIGDLSKDRPIDFVRQWGDRPAAYIACGGDGTAAAMLEAVRAVCRRGRVPPVGLVALGTGNDLARVLGWPQATGVNIDHLLSRFRAASDQPFDRWVIEGPRGFKLPWYNYCSLGIDARIAYQFHHLRRRHATWFRSRVGNKMVYAMLGLIDPGARLAIRLDDDRHGMVPDWSRVMLWSNIPSYAGGGFLGDHVAWDDGLLDGFLLGNSIQVAMGTRGLRTPHHLHSATERTFTVLRRSALQVDGEPMLIGPGRYRLRSGGQVRVLVAPPDHLRPPHQPQQ